MEGAQRSEGEAVPPIGTSAYLIFPSAVKILLPGASCLRARVMLHHRGADMDEGASTVSATDPMKVHQEQRSSMPGAPEPALGVPAA